ncbi:MAG: hypothetical protein M9936_16520 [Caldilinea sp.]|nr:hypothetical protein [Caldilineaceae bacterium]MCO5211299.1 hypothetical protein [Caldilinea sp.]MCW5844517.1 hypothetical protein [Caldilinea sp.]
MTRIGRMVADQFIQSVLIRRIRSIRVLFFLIDRTQIGRISANQSIQSVPIRRIRSIRVPFFTLDRTRIVAV